MTYLNFRPPLIAVRYREGQRIGVMNNDRRGMTATLGSGEAQAETVQRNVGDMRLEEDDR